MASKPSQTKFRRAGSDMPWLSAIQQVLKESSEPLHITEITERIIEGGLRTNVGATPRDTVASYLSVSIRSESSPFVKVARATFKLANPDETASEEALHKTVPEEERLKEEALTEPESGALRAFGMYWQRNLVSWTNPPTMYGKEDDVASPVNFALQKGVYLLHDRERVIYVGRTEKGTLFDRLKAHNTDRLSGRWDRFSWFGILSVGEGGTLSDKPLSWTPKVVIDTMEALLIESLEPPLNRRRGDKLDTLEYIQVADPKIEEERERDTVAKIMKRAGHTA